MTHFTDATAHFVTDALRSHGMTDIEIMALFDGARELASSEFTARSMELPIDARITDLPSFTAWRLAQDRADSVRWVLSTHAAATTTREA